MNKSKEHSKVKNNTESVMRKCYINSGKDIKKVIDVSTEMLKHQKGSPLLRGELCEVVLVLMLEHFIEKNNLKDKGWFISKGLILKDIKNKDSGYFTEVDVTLFTPRRIYSFECKSYKGDKVIVDKCQLMVKRGSRRTKGPDIFDQHFKHFKVLLEHVNPYMLNVGKTSFRPYSLIYFDFSDGEIDDQREEKYKRMMPIYSPKNLYKLFANYYDQPVYWNISGVHKIISIVEKAGKVNTSKHLAYVKDLNKRR